jgi:hypothetical protein
VYHFGNIKNFQNEEGWYYVDTYTVVTTVVLVGGMGLWLLVKHLQKKWELGDLLKDIGSIDISLMRISPQMKQSAGKFSVKNAAELRQLSPENLIDLLSCASSMLVVFEKQIGHISDAYAKYENLLTADVAESKINDGFLFKELKRKQRIKNEIASNEKMFAPAKAQLDKQLEQAMIVFNEEFSSVESLLAVIPEKYRMSIILNKMCEYLSDGETDSWEGCVKIFKEDVHRLQQNENFQAVVNRLDCVVDHLGKIERNTGAIAFFSAITAFNTRGGALLPKLPTNTL